MQRDTIGFLFSIQCKIKSLTSANTSASGPLKAQLLKFLAAPNPPGIKIPQSSKSRRVRQFGDSISSELIQLCCPSVETKIVAEGFDSANSSDKSAFTMNSALGAVDARFSNSSSLN